MKGLMTDMATGDLLLNNGTLAIGDTSEQCAQMIVVAEKGEFKEYPQLGVGISQFLKSVGLEGEMLRNIRVQLSLDGIKPKELTFTDGKLRIEL